MLDSVRTSGADPAGVASGLADLDAQHAAIDGVERDCHSGGAGISLVSITSSVDQVWWAGGWATVLAAAAATRVQVVAPHTV